MKKLQQILAATLGACALAGGAAHAGGELAVNTTAPALYDFPVERVHAAVDLYREGGGQEEIAVSALSKLGEAARTELLAMQHATKNAGEAVAILEILNVCSETAAPVQSKTEAAPPPRESRSSAQRTHARPVQKTRAATKSAPAPQPARKKSQPEIVISVTGMTNPLMPWATRF